MSLKYQDLKGTVLPVISIDEFQPKAGEVEETVVVAFYLTDQSPAQDLNTFIQRSSIDVIDVEVSPNTDLEGRYLVFVELDRNSMLPAKIRALIKDVENLAGSIDWEIKTYLSGNRVFSINDPELFQYVILNPKAYVTKDKFMKESAEQQLKEFLKDSYINHLQINEDTITLSTRDSVITAQLVDVGEYDQVIGRNLLSESAFYLGPKSYELAALGRMLADCEVTPIDNFVCVSKLANNSLLLLKNIEIRY